MGLTTAPLISFNSDRTREVLTQSALRHVFPDHIELLPQMYEGYEVELALAESMALPDDALERNSGYFGSVNGRPTRHFLLCRGEPVRTPEFSSSRLKSFFSSKLYKTSYATHGLFPYRGKFHPQMVKGLLNAIGLRPGDTVLDPMMGSGTTLLEASLMGINSVGIDASPFCVFMARTKLDALKTDLHRIRFAASDARVAFEYFRQYAGDSAGGFKRGAAGSAKLFGSQQVHDFLLLAYLDSVGYSERSKSLQPYDQFKGVLERYIFVADKVQTCLDGVEEELGGARELQGDARAIPLASDSVDGIVFSPPYSFAVDYLENDAFHLGVFGVDVVALRENMVGLRGKTLRQKYDQYVSDMDRVLGECSRVLKPGRICCIVVGTNSSQLSKVLGVKEDEVPGIDSVLIEIARTKGFEHVRSLERQIVGISNTMRTERIVMLQR